LTWISNSEKNVSMGALMHHGLERAAARLGSRDFVRAGDDRWSFRELDDLADGFAGRLGAAGVDAGARVAVMMGNRVEFVIAVHAVSKLGAASVLLSPAWKAAEIDHAVGLTGPVHAIADGAAVGLLRDRIAAVTDVEDPPLASLPAAGGSAAGGPAAGAAGGGAAAGGGPVADTDEAVLVFSSGTTGLPKAVRHTHRSIGHATAHWCDVLDLGEDDRFQVATPPSHILGLLNLLAAASAGVTVRLHARFNLEELLHRVESERMTLEMAVAPIALALANLANLEDYDLSSLRYIMWGATPVTETVARTVTRRSGVRWLPAYGASEVPVISCNPVRDPDAWRLDSAGLPPKGVELRIADLDTGRILDAGEIGEIQVRSPSRMAGYLPAEADRDAFVDDWYRTGDVGWLEPEGWVHLTDRSKEMIKVSGFQVAPAEIEAVLLGHPAVLDCAVFGLPDERAGELPVAAVQADPARPVSGAELLQLVADSLAHYKQLRHVVFVDAIPRLPSGKALRRQLRDEWVPELAARGPDA
jgi:long-chain acyl-CoA synthetase